MNRWFVIYVPKNEMRNVWSFDNYPEASITFHKKVPKKRAFTMNIDELVLSNGYCSNSGLIIIDKQKCKTDWVLEFLKPIIRKRRNEILNNLLLNE